MPYDNTKPQPGESKGATQPVFLENFDQIYDMVGQDHEQFNTANVGKHKYVTLTQQANPDQLVADQATLFSKADTVTTKAGVFWQKEVTGGGAAGAVLSMTDFKVAGSEGWTVLPSGIQMAWGTYTIASGAQPGAAKVFTSPFSNNCFSVTLTLSSQGGGNYDAEDYITYISAIANTGFTASRIRADKTVATLNFYYIAIGN